MGCRWYSNPDPCKLPALRKLKTILLVLVTAVITAVLTSAFWIYAYGNGRGGESAAAPAASDRGDKIDVVLGPTGIAIPVSGVKPAGLTDTFTQARAGGARVHDAIDIMAAEGTPVIAAAPGRVEKLFFSNGGGGNTVYVRSPDNRYMFYYAHLQAYAPGLAEGQAVKQGDVIGTVGHTGNASPEGPHLHFAINRMADGEKWYQGTPINPYPLLVGKRTRS